ncbi:MAG: enoyl-CoA hydratase/isomerase family protein [Longimicrobiales bacterium]
MTDSSPSPDAPELLVERRGDVRILTLNRPHRLNAVSPGLYGALDETLAHAAADPEVRALVITGTGRGFSVGADLQAHGDAPLGPDDRRRYVELAQRVNHRIQTLPKPVVAAVNGHAVGAGFELALSCDLIVVAREAKLRLPEAALGTFVGGGVTYTLVRRLGEVRAREILLLCPFLRGEEAERQGLANRVVDADDVLPTALDLAHELARRAPRSVRLLKELLHTAVSDGPEAALQREADALLECMGTADWVEGIEAFREKREPRFTGE